MSSTNDGQNKTIELLIDKKIAETKLLVAEKRLNYLMAFGAALLTIFGIILPIFLTHESTNRVDQAIERMNAKFTELAGKQLRKAKIACYVDGQPLENSIVTFDPANQNKTILVKNIGDGTADYIRMRLYTNSKDENLKEDISSAGFHNLFYEQQISDKSGFESMNNYRREINLLPAQDSIPINFNMQNSLLNNNDLNIAAILMIFYGEPVPVEVPFTISIKTHKS